MPAGDCDERHLPVQLFEGAPNRVQGSDRRRLAAHRVDGQSNQDVRALVTRPSHALVDEGRRELEDGLDLRVHVASHQLLVQSLCLGAGLFLQGRPADRPVRFHQVRRALGRQLGSARPGGPAGFQVGVLEEDALQEGCDLLQHGLRRFAEVDQEDGDSQDIISRGVYA